MLQKVWLVPDIECEGCVRSIRHALSDMDGVRSVSVDLLTKRVEVEYDPNRVSPEQLRQQIQQVGFNPQECE